MSEPDGNLVPFGKYMYKYKYKYKYKGQRQEPLCHPHSPRW